MKTYLLTVFASVFAISLALLVPVVYSQPSDKLVLCHASDTKNDTFDQLELSASELTGHLDGSGAPLAGHDLDFVPADSDCSKANDLVRSAQNPANPVPEPLTMLLFGTGLAGLGYASRRYLARDHAESEREGR